MQDAVKMEFRPDHVQYTKRCFLNALWGALIANASLVLPIAILVLVPVLALAGGSDKGWPVALGVCAAIGVNILYWVIIGLYIPAWVRNVRYEMTDEEVIVHKGVFNRVHKIVPYCTVTNVSITRGWLDRIGLGIGNVNIQTAGSGASSVAEERLVGLADFEEIRDRVVESLRRYRADSGPALGGGASGARDARHAEMGNGEVAREILQELRSIRELLERH
jgi:membrane protein YdbS with pleckstrin-like domain